MELQGKRSSENNICDDSISRLDVASHINSLRRVRITWDLRKVFNHFLDNGERKISASRLRIIALMLGLDMKLEEARSLMTQIDKDGDGFIDFEEFTDFYWNQSCYLEGTALSQRMDYKKLQWQIWWLDYPEVCLMGEGYHFGDNGDGKISASKLRQNLIKSAFDIEPAVVESIMTMIDKVEDGFIYLKEFCCLGFRDFFRYLFGWEVYKTQEHLWRNIYFWDYRHASEKMLSDLFENYQNDSMSGKMLDAALNILRKYNLVKGNLGVTADDTGNSRVARYLLGENGDIKMSASKLGKLLREGGFNMTPVQVERIMAMMEKNGFIDLHKFCGLGFRDFFTYQLGLEVTKRNEREPLHKFCGLGFCDFLTYRLGLEVNKRNDGEPCYVHMATDPSTSGKMWFDTANSSTSGRRYHTTLNVYGTETGNAVKTLDPSLGENYYLGTGYSQIIRYHDVTGPSVSQHPSLEDYGETCFDNGNASSSGREYHTILNVYGTKTSNMRQSPPAEVYQAVRCGIERANINEDDPTDSVGRLHPGDDPQDQEEHIDNMHTIFANASRIFSSVVRTISSNFANATSATRGFIDSLNGNMLPQIDQSAEYGVNVARTLNRASASAGGNTTSNVAKSVYAIGLIYSLIAVLLGDTRWGAATPILTKTAEFAYGVGALVDLGSHLPAEHIWAIITAILIPIAVLVLANCHR